MEKKIKDVENNEKDLKESTVYEISYLLDPSLEEEDLSSVISSVKESFESKGGIFVSEAWPKKMILSYKILVSKDGKKSDYDTAYFGWQKYEVASDKINEVKTDIEKNISIVRFMIIKTTREDIAPFKPRAIRTEQKDAKQPISISKEELDKTIEELVIE